MRGVGHCREYQELTASSVVVSGGKRDEALILPINSSLSVTLHQDQVTVHCIDNTVL